MRRSILETGRKRKITLMVTLAGLGIVTAWALLAAAWDAPDGNVIPLWQPETPLGIGVTHIAIYEESGGQLLAIISYLDPQNEPDQILLEAGQATIDVTEDANLDEALADFRADVAGDVPWKINGQGELEAI